MRKELTLVFISILCAVLNLTAQNPYIRHYTTLDGLPSNLVYQVYQDSHKFLWFATDAGVARYDGSRFTYYRKQDGLSSNDVVKIKEDALGRIWFFNLNATLNFFYHDKIYNEKTAPFLDSLKTKEFFKDFFEDTDRTLYWYNNKHPQIYSLDTQNHVKIIQLPSIEVKVNADIPPFEGMVLRFLDRPDGKEFYLWALAGLYKMDLSSVNFSLCDSGLNIAKVFPVSGDELFLFSVGEDGKGKGCSFLRRFDRFFKLKSAFDTIIPGSDFISNIIRDRSRNLWISTFDKGLFCLRDYQVIYHLQINEAQQVMQDHEGNLWVGSLKDGAYKISPYVVQHYHFDKAFFNDAGIFALSPDINDGLWCTNNSSVYLVRGRHIMDADLGITGSSFNQIVQVDKKTLIVGEVNLRHFALEGVRESETTGRILFDKVTRSFSQFKNIIRNPSTGMITSFESYGLVFIDQTFLFRKYTRTNVNERIFNIFYNSDSDLVVNANTNYLYKDDRMVPYVALASLNNKIIAGHINLPEGFELFNVEGDSLFFFNGTRLYNLTNAFNFHVDLQVKHMEFHDSTLFIGTSRNIYLCENPQNVISGKPFMLQPVDLAFRNIYDICFYKDTLFVASDDGLTVIPSRSIHEIGTGPPIPYIRSIKIDDEASDIQKGALSVTGLKRISVDFSSISYSFSPVMYSYKMEGSGSKWNDVNGTEVVFQDLPAGDYQFMLRVRKSTSGWSEPVIFPFRIHALFWQRPVFYVILMFIATSLIGLFYAWRKNEELKKQRVEHQLLLLEQKALQSMMNPHFIFNTLGSIQNYLLQSKPGEAGLFLSQFARLVRQNMNAINQSVISLEEEIDRLKNYLDLEKLRMENKFEYRLEMDENLESEDILIPSMIIQPFVENAIWHGIASIEGKGFISVIFAQPDDKSLKIIIEDNGIGIRNSEKFSVKSGKHMRLGMDMTRKRLALMGKKYNITTRIEFSEPNPGCQNPGTRVELVVPVHLP